jgi:hypothetical protein
MKRPKANRSTITRLAKEAWLRAGHTDPLPTHYIFAVRGYWPLTMGKTPGNDPGVYDDAWFYVSPTTFLAIAANTDPSRYGWNAGAGKPMAVLDTGFWPFRRGPHKNRTPALRQLTLEEARKVGLPGDGRFSVTRTYAPGDSRNYKEAGYFAINCHSGGVNGTSSEGCQTAPPDTFAEFMGIVWKETKAAGVGILWYGLVDGPLRDV